MPLQLLLSLCCMLCSLFVAALLVMFSGSMSLANHRLPDPADVEVPLQVCLVRSRSFDIDLSESFPSSHTGHSTVHARFTLACLSALKQEPLACSWRPLKAAASNSNVPWRGTGATSSRAGTKTEQAI